jgi:hypothetical protein
VTACYSECFNADQENRNFADLRGVETGKKQTAVPIEYVSLNVA